MPSPTGAKRPYRIDPQAARERAARDRWPVTRPMPTSVPWPQTSTPSRSAVREAPAPGAGK